MNILNPSQNVECYSCNKNTDLAHGQKILRSEECPHCNADMHCCKMCRFYDPQHYNECKEPSAERIVDKEKANFCDYFELGKGGDGGSSKDDLLSAADALFKN